MSDLPLREVFSSEFDGKHVRRHDGIIHIVSGTSSDQPSGMGWWVLITRCNKPAKYHPTKDSHRHRWQNKLTDAAPTCIACIAGVAT